MSRSSLRLDFFSTFFSIFLFIFKNTPLQITSLHVVWYAVCAIFPPAYTNNARILCFYPRVQFNWLSVRPNVNAKRFKFNGAMYLFFSLAFGFDCNEQNHTGRIRIMYIRQCILNTRISKKSDFRAYNLKEF